MEPFGRRYRVGLSGLLTPHYAPCPRSVSIDTAACGRQINVAGPSEKCDAVWARENKLETQKKSLEKFRKVQKSLEIYLYKNLDNRPTTKSYVQHGHIHVHVHVHTLVNDTLVNDTLVACPVRYLSGPYRGVRRSGGRNCQR